MDYFLTCAQCGDGQDAPFDIDDTCVCGGKYAASPEGSTGESGCLKHSYIAEIRRNKRAYCVGCEREALRHCLKVLKSHHMTKPVISALVLKTEEIAGIY